MDKPRSEFKFNADALQHLSDKENYFQSMTSKTLLKIKSVGKLFWITVIAPTALSILYFGFLASNVYVSESRFVVRSPDKPSASGLGVLLKSAGFSSTGDEVYAAQSFVLSRDALKALNKNSDFEKSYSRNGVFLFDRFGTGFSGTTFEDLFDYYESKVKINHESTSSITTLSVRAFSPRDAQKFNEQLLEMAEATVNRLNARGRADLIEFAQTEVNDAKQKAAAAAIALSTFRNRMGVVDPEKQATVQIQMVSKLQDELIATRTQLQQLRAFTPANPQIEVLNERAQSLAREIDNQTGKVAGDRQSLSSTAALYQRHLLESQFADKQLASAMASLEEARNEARRKQAYVERIVQPGLPDEATEPKRLRSIAATIAFSLILWGVLTMLFAGVREHQQ